MVVWLFIALSVNGQVVKEVFPISKISESFDIASPDWEQANNQDKFYIFQKESYYLHRKHKTKSGFVLPNIKERFSDFELEVKLQLQKHNNKEQAAGLVFMAQENSSGALVLEISQSRAYRLMKWNGGGFEYISGEDKKSGWVRTKAIANAQKDVLLKVRCADRKYDIYINDQYIATFAELAFKVGKVGLIIEPDTKVAIDDFSVKVPRSAPSDSLDQPLRIDSVTNDEILTQVIIRLRAQLNDKDQSIESLQQQLISCSEALNNKLDQPVPGSIDSTEYKSLQQKLRAEKAKNAKLKEQYDELLAFKQVVQQYENGDIIIGLSEVISKEKAKNNNLKQQNATLENEKDYLLKRIEEMTKELEKLKFELNLIEE